MPPKPRSIGIPDPAHTRAAAIHGQLMAACPENPGGAVLIAFPQEAELLKELYPCWGLIKYETNSSPSGC